MFWSIFLCVCAFSLVISTGVFRVVFPSLFLSLSLSMSFSISLLFAAEAPRYQIPCGTTWFTGRVSGKHRARVAAMFENVRCLFRFIGCWFDILCLVFMPPACWLLMFPASSWDLFLRVSRPVCFACNFHSPVL